MTEEQAKHIAQQLIAESNLDQCEYECIRRVSLKGKDNAIRHEWVVGYRFLEEPGIVESPDSVMVAIDDATGIAHLVEML